MAVEINTVYWKMYKMCTCGGVLKHKYRHTQNPSIEVHIMPNKGTFILFQSGNVIVKGKTTELKATLQKYEPVK